MAVVVPDEEVLVPWAKKHGHARSFADARAYNLGKRWRAEKFTEPEVAGHCARANATVLANLGYTCP